MSRNQACPISCCSWEATAHWELCICLTPIRSGSSQWAVTTRWFCYLPPTRVGDRGHLPSQRTDTHSPVNFRDSGQYSEGTRDQGLEQLRGTDYEPLPTRHKLHGVGVGGVYISVHPAQVSAQSSVVLPTAAPLCTTLHWAAPEEFSPSSEWCNAHWCLCNLISHKFHWRVGSQPPSASSGQRQSRWRRSMLRWSGLQTTERQQELTSSRVLLAKPMALVKDLQMLLHTVSKY